MDAPLSSIVGGAGASGPPPGGGESPAIAPAATPEPSTPPSGPRFFDGLPDDLKGRLTKFEKADAATVAKSYLELEGKLSQRPDGVKPLTPESSADDIAAYHKAMGVPEKADEYDFTNHAFPEEIAPTSDELASWKQVFHAAHLTPAQVAAVMGAYSREVSANYVALNNARREQYEQTRSAMRQKFGAQWDHMEAGIQRFIAKEYGEDGADAFGYGYGDKSPGNHPVLIDVVLRLMRATNHDQYVVADSKGNLISPAEARSQVDALYTQMYQAQREGKQGDFERIKQEIMRLQPVAGQLG